MSILRSLLSQWRPPARSPEPAPDPVLTLEQYERCNPTATLVEDGIDVLYCTPNLHTQWRVDSLFIKEPETIEWIRGFAPGEVLVDIGANVGMYSIWAAKTRGVRVFAFEPESQNYALLYRNIVANGLSGQVRGYCLALSDQRQYAELHLSTFLLGGSCHTFGEKIDYRLRPREVGVSQGSMSTTLDEMIADGAVEAPHHIKIDVDGLEHKVLAGARQTLRNPRLKSVLIEINTHLDQHLAVVESLQSLGFSYSQEQVASGMRKSGDFEGCANYVFRR
jgi:FkbM family methyltransferase